MGSNHGGASAGHQTGRHRRTQLRVPDRSARRSLPYAAHKSGVLPQGRRVSRERHPEVGQVVYRTQRPVRAAESGIPAELAERLRRERTLTLALKVIPKASKDEVVGFLDNGSLKVKIAAAPEKG